MQQQFYITKQTFIKKLGKKEDQCVIDSDSELDARLEAFRALQHSSFVLQNVIELYQDGIISLAQEENILGRFLRDHGKVDKTRAGKMMIAVGKTMVYSAQQRVSLRVPLVRLYQEVDTFRHRAIVDTLHTVNRMEESRTQYRAALLWMKDVSESLQDPDMYKQLEKHRKVQSQVKQTKVRFDKLKTDCLQKVDLLSASRCNMFSHALASYQQAMVVFWENTSKTLDLVAEAFKGYQHYEFSMLKELTETSKQLAERTSAEDELLDKLPFLNDDENGGNDKDRQLFWKEYHDSDSKPSQSKASDSRETEPDSLQSIYPPHPSHRKKGGAKSKQKQEEANLLDLDLGAGSNGDLENGSSNLGGPNLGYDLLSSDNGDMAEDTMSLLRDILGDGTTDGCLLQLQSEEPDADSEFLREWDEVFSKRLAGGTSADAAGKSDQKQGNGAVAVQGPNSDGSVLPSHLLDLDFALLSMSLQTPSGDGTTLIPDGGSNMSKDLISGGVPSGASCKQISKSAMTTKTKDKSDWFNLFADLDPLANPDAIGKSGHALESDRTC